MTTSNGRVRPTATPDDRLGVTLACGHWVETPPGLDRGDFARCDYHDRPSKIQRVNVRYADRERLETPHVDDAARRALIVPEIRDAYGDADVYQGTSPLARIVPILDALDNHAADDVVARMSMRRLLNEIHQRLVCDVEIRDGSILDVLDHQICTVLAHTPSTWLDRRRA